MSDEFSSVEHSIKEIPIDLIYCIVVIKKYRSGRQACSTPQIRRCDRGSPSSSTEGKRAGHKGPKKAKEETLEQRRIAKEEKDDLQAKFEEDREQIQGEKDQLLAEQIGVREAVTRALRSMLGLKPMEEETIEIQVGKLAEAIQQLQAKVAELELQALPSTPQEVRDQREETARSAVKRIKALVAECKQLSNQSAQTYESLAEDPKLRTLETHL
jgi:hypothetical protein